MEYQPTTPCSHGERERLCATLLELLRVPSVTGNEAAISHLIEVRVRDLCARLPVPSTCERVDDSFVAFLGQLQDLSRPLVVVSGHVDTVPGEDLGDRIQLLNDRVIGLGASDMKAGLALMLELLQQPVLAASPYRLAFLFYAGEEGPAEKNQLERVLLKFPELQKAALCLFPEPTDRTVQLGCLGLLNVKVRFRGKAAHSARPWLGENAIHRAGNLLCRLAERQPNVVQFGKVEYREVISATVAHGGTATNVIPASFEVNLNVRIAPGKGMEEALREVKELVGPGADIDVSDVAPAGAVPVKNALYDGFQRRFEIPEAPKQAYTDVALFSQYGVDAINFGPGLTEQCHVPGEYVLIEDLVWCWEKYRAFLTSGV